LPFNFFQVNPAVASARALVNDGFSNYHAVEFEVRRRRVAGFTFQASYTFARGLSDFDGDANELLNDVRPSSVINPRYSNKEYLPRHTFYSLWVYELPFGPKKRFDPNSGFLDKLFGGWQFGGIVNWRSGRPFSITSGVGTFHRSGVSAENTVDLAQPLTVSQLRSLTGVRTIGNSIFYFDPCMSSIIGATCSDSAAIPNLFQLPQPGRLGQLIQSVYFGSRRFYFDFNFSKRTTITESTNIEFRWEVFNAFNNVNFSLPETDIFSPSFGQILSTNTQPRLMQFALKFNF
jgi:hypothetical protein